MLEKQDFIRHLPDYGRSMHRTSISQMLHIDGPLLLIVLTIMGLGLAVLYSASDQSLSVLLRQASRMGVGIVIMLLLAQLPPMTYKRWAPWLYCMGIILLALVLLIGTDAKGAKRWLDLPGLRFQPSEIMKLALPMMVAWYLAEKNLPPARLAVLVVCAMIALPVLLIVKEPDLGTSILIGTSGLIILLLAGLNGWIVALLGMLSLPAAAGAWYFVMHDYQKQRVLTFLNPEREPLGTGWNIIQSKIAIGSGGVTGKGWLNGTQSHLDFLPESATDFIIAVLAEELGLVGIMVLLTLYLLLVARGLFIALLAQDTFSRLLAGGVMLTFFVYVFVNIGMVSGLLPVVGVPLPFVSYGGTSIVTLLASLGIVMSIQTHRKLLTN